MIFRNGHWNWTNYTNSRQNPCSRVLLYKLRVVLVVKIFPIPYRTRDSVTVLTWDSHCILLCWITSIHHTISRHASNPNQYFPSIFTNVSSFHALRLRCSMRHLSHECCISRPSHLPCFEHSLESVIQLYRVPDGRDGLQVRRKAADLLNKRSQTTENVWPLAIELTRVMLPR
jgi:hypothetical protein